MVVLHRAWDKPSYLREILARDSMLPVVIAAQGEHLQTSTAYIGKPSEHLTLGLRGVSELIDDPRRCYRNRTIDLRF
jgi:two-component system, chemotaxis family, protein-glutamate methylesterase/glutaminase